VPQFWWSLPLLNITSLAHLVRFLIPQVAGPEIKSQGWLFLTFLFTSQIRRWALAQVPSPALLLYPPPSTQARFGPVLYVEPFSFICLHVMVKSISFEPYFQMQSVLYEN
jgi:hypothetical protein